VASTLGASAVVGGLCHTAERPIRKAETRAGRMAAHIRTSLNAVMCFRVLLAAPLSALLACDSSPLSVPPTAACSEAGVQCQLPEGPLGVCERSPCAPGAAPPCFKCTPQH
jgi:hypothetical protein